MLLRFLLLSALMFSAYAEELNIYVDADFTGYSESSVSIEMGIKTALSMNKELLGKTKVNIIRLDHKANSLRSLKNIKNFLKDSNRFALFSGIHSPPLLANKDFINQNKALFLIPWAAASPITRAKTDDNWIFRLSVDDSKAGSFLVDQIAKEKFSKPFLLLEKTGWGKNNSSTINSALLKKSIKASGEEFFNWRPTESNVRIKLRKIQNSGADCIIFVGNAHEGEIFARAMLELNINLPIISHWGILGGNFFSNLGQDLLTKQNWSFIQTQFSFTSNKLSDYQSKVLKAANALYPKNVNGVHINAPTGFIHSYDLTTILLHAWVQSGKKHPIDFQSLKQKLENLDGNIQGLIKSYNKPFSKYNLKSPDAHEALGFEDLRLGSFDENGNVFLK